jgi:hypothetical protein
MLPHPHFGMPGTFRKHTLVYTIVIAMAMLIIFACARFFLGSKTRENVQ